jgi:hypothetical protein
MYCCGRSVGRGARETGIRGYRDYVIVESRHEGEDGEPIDTLNIQDAIVSPGLIESGVLMNRFKEGEIDR